MSSIQAGYWQITARLKRPRLWLEALLLLALAVLVFAGKDIVPFNGDESAFVWLSGDYDRLVKQGRPDEIRYQANGGTAQYIRVLTGSITSLSIGLARDLAGVRSPGVSGNWNWNYPPNAGEQMWLENIQQGRMPSPAMLALARTPTSLFGALSVILFFIAALQLTRSRVAAWSATVLLATNAEFLLNVRRAIQEGPKFFFLCLTLCFAAHLLNRLKEGRPGRAGYVWLGVGSGLTLASKQDVAMVLFAIYAALAFVPALEKDSRKLWLQNTSGLLAASCIALAVFFACMPVWWGWWANIVILTGLALILFQVTSPEPGSLVGAWLIAGVVLLAGLSLYAPRGWAQFPKPLIRMVQTRQEQLDAQVEYRVKYHQPYLSSLKDRVAYMQEIFLSARVMYSESSRFDIPPMVQQIEVYEASPLYGRPDFAPLNLLIAVLFCCGVWKAVRNLGAENMLLLCTFFISALILVPLVPLQSHRYFLVLQLPYALLAGVGLAQVWEWGRGWAGAIQTRKQPGS